MIPSILGSVKIPDTPMPSNLPVHTFAPEISFREAISMAIGANRTYVVLEVHARTVSDSVMVMRLESWPCHGKF